MANEVIINIESSLAAMAFVVADQQQDIKELREAIANEHKANMDYHKMLADANCKVEELNSQMMANQTEAEEVITELKEKLRNTTDDFENMVCLRDELQNKLDNSMEVVQKSYIKDLDWTPWPKGKECIKVSFDELKYKDDYPVSAIMMYELRDGYQPESPTGKIYDKNAPFIQMYPVHIDSEKQYVSLYSNVNMIPRLYAWVYPQDLITSYALGLFALQLQGDNNNVAE